MLVNGFRSWIHELHEFCENRPADCSRLRLGVWYGSRGAGDLFWGLWRLVSTAGGLLTPHLPAGSKTAKVLIDP